MAKRKAIPKAKETQLNPALVAWTNRVSETLTRITVMVLAFWLENPMTQWAQNPKRDKTASTIKIAGIAVPYAFGYEGGYEVVVNPNTGKRGKQEVAAYFAYINGRVFGGPLAILNTTGSIMTWCARKIVTGRSRSVEGAMMFATLTLLESSGCSIESLTVGDDIYSRDAIMAKGAVQLADYEASRKSGSLYLPNRLKGKKSRLIVEGTTL